MSSIKEYKLKMQLACQQWPQIGIIAATPSGCTEVEERVLHVLAFPAPHSPEAKGDGFPVGPLGCDTDPPTVDERKLSS